MVNSVAKSTKKAVGIRSVQVHRILRKFIQTPKMDLTLGFKIKIHFLFRIENCRLLPNSLKYNI